MTDPMTTTATTPGNLAGDDDPGSDPAAHGPDRQAAVPLSNGASCDCRRRHPDQGATKAHGEQRNAEDGCIRCHGGAGDAGQREDEAAAEDGQQSVSGRERSHDERAEEIGEDIGRAQEASDGVRVVEVIADCGEQHAVGEAAEGLCNHSAQTDEDDGGPSAGCTHGVIVTNCWGRRRVGVRRFR